MQQLLFKDYSEENVKSKEITSKREEAASLLATLMKVNFSSASSGEILDLKSRTLSVLGGLTLQSNSSLTVRDINTAFTQFASALTIQYQSVQNLHAEELKVEHLYSMGQIIIRQYSNPTLTNEETIDLIKEGLIKQYEQLDYKHIIRIFGDPLSMDDCYINLSIIEHDFQQQKEKDALQQWDNRVNVNRLSSYERIYQADYQKIVQLPNLFDERPKNETSNEKYYPKHIHILGRAGSGKTTLCKKIVYEYLGQTKKASDNSRLGYGIWQNKFKWLIWLPLRNLKTYSPRDEAYTLGDVFYREYFKQHYPQTKAIELAQMLWGLVENKPDEVCLLLDGKDEVAHEIHSSHLKEVLEKLFNNKCYSIVTSRPWSDPHPHTDLELETIGFTPGNIDSYIRKIFANNSETILELQNLIDKNPIVAGLANVPIQLDILGYSLDYLKSCIKENHSEDLSLTMTALYQAMIYKLWLKYIDRDPIKKRLKEIKKLSFKRELEITPKNADGLAQLKPNQIDNMVKVEQTFLKHLAFKGMQESKIEFSGDELDKVAASLEKHQAKLFKKYKLSTRELVESIKLSPFLTTQDKGAEELRKYYFIHLTNQEFFAADYIVNHFADNEMQSYIQWNKNYPRYEQVWCFVSGLLAESNQQSFFQLLLSEPRDLIGFYEVLLLMRCVNEMTGNWNWMTEEVKESFKTYLLNWIRWGLYFRTSQDATDFNIFMAEEENYIKADQKEKSTVRIFFECLGQCALLRNHLKLLDTLTLIKKLDHNLITLFNIREEKYVSFLVAKLEDSQTSETELVTIIEVLGELQLRSSQASKVAKVFLQMLAKDHPKEVRSAAAITLAKSKVADTKTVDTLLNYVEDENMSSSILRALILLGTHDKSIVKRLFEQLGKLSKQIQLEAALVLNNIALVLSNIQVDLDNDFSWLITLLASEDYKLTQEALRALMNLKLSSPPVMDALLKIAEEIEDYFIFNKRIEIHKGKVVYKKDYITMNLQLLAMSLRILEVHDERFIEKFLNLLNCTNINISHKAIEALSGLKVYKQEHVNKILLWLEKVDFYWGEARYNAVYALSRLQFEHTWVQQLISDLLHSDKWQLREAGVNLIAILKCLDSTYIQRLLSLLTDKEENNQVRMAAVHSLSKLDIQGSQLREFKDTLLKLLRDQKEDRFGWFGRYSIAFSLIGLKIFNEEIVHTLRAMLTDPEIGGRRVEDALQTLSQYDLTQYLECFHNMDFKGYLNPAVLFKSTPLLSICEHIFKERPWDQGLIDAVFIKAFRTFNSLWLQERKFYCSEDETLQINEISEELFEAIVYQLFYLTAHRFFNFLPGYDYSKINELKHFQSHLIQLKAKLRDKNQMYFSRKVYIVIAREEEKKNSKRLNQLILNLEYFLGPQNITTRYLDRIHLLRYEEEKNFIILILGTKKFKDEIEETEKFILEQTKSVDNLSKSEDDLSSYFKSEREYLQDELEFLKENKERSILFYLEEDLKECYVTSISNEWILTPLRNDLEYYRGFFKILEVLYSEYKAIIAEYHSQFTQDSPAEIGETKSSEMKGKSSSGIEVSNILSQTLMPPPRISANEADEEKKLDDGKNYAIMGGQKRN